VAAVAAVEARAPVAQAQAWRRPGRNQPALTKRFLHKLKRVKLTGLGKMKKK
jgi:hypothetical protein